MFVIATFCIKNVAVIPRVLKMEYTVCVSLPKYIYIYIYLWPPLWSSDQSSCLQIQRSGFNYRHYQISLEVVGLEQGPLSLVSTTEELLERKSSGSGLENRDCSHRDLSWWPRVTLYPQKLALTSLTSGVCLVGIVHSRIKATELLIIHICLKYIYDIYTSRNVDMISVSLES
jgi:hypothetical protein